MVKPTEAELKDAFDMFDQDGSGGISSAELGSVLNKLGIKHTDQDLHQLLEVCDTDGSGSIEFNEFKRAMTS